MFRSLRKSRKGPIQRSGSGWRVNARRGLHFRRLLCEQLEDRRLLNGQFEYEIDIRGAQLPGSCTYNDATGEDVVYQIVGDLESDINNNKISVSSPIARALIGKEEGDEVEVKTPTGITNYEILSVRYV